jgi:cytochrome P450
MSATKTAADGTPVPISDLDPFSTAFFDDPYPAHTALREAGPVVWLRRYSVWAAARYAEVQAVLTDWETFCSSAGVGLSDFRKEKPWRPPSLLLEADPPDHTRARAVVARILSPAALRRLRETFAQEAEALVARVVVQGRFDGIRDIAHAFPLKVFPDAVGLAPDGRDNLLAYGNMAFNAFGPRNALFEESFREAVPVQAWIAERCRREHLAPDGFGAQIYAAADAGEIGPEEAPLLVRSFLTAGVDTTVNGIGNALYCLATHPEEWAKLRHDPSLARAAFEEALRTESPVQTFFRTTMREASIGGVRIPAGEKVLLFLSAANRDPRQWEAPDRFDIDRRASGHVGFGSGIHGCVGQMVARLEGEVVLSALAKRVATMAPDGPPVRRYNNTLRALASLPLTVTLKQ